MSGPLADYVFWVLAAAVAVAHGVVLRSTLRGLRAVPTARARVWEWVWAVLPMASLAVLFVWTWHTMHPDSLTFLIPANRVAPGGIGS